MSLSDFSVERHAIERTVRRPPDDLPVAGLTLDDLDVFTPPTPEQAGMADRARALEAAHDSSAGDEEQQLLIREIMAQFREWCVGRGYGDPFV